MGVREEGGAMGSVQATSGGEGRPPAAAPRDGEGEAAARCVFPRVG